jgi:hypothetical protein
MSWSRPCFREHSDQLSPFKGSSEGSVSDILARIVRSTYRYKRPPGEDSHRWEEHDRNGRGHQRRPQAGGTSSGRPEEVGHRHCTMAGREGRARPEEHQRRGDAASALFRAVTRRMKWRP